MGEYISTGAVKVIEVIGVSTESFDDAIEQAVRKASESIQGITGVEVESLTGRVSNGSISQYHATVKLAFPVR